MPRTEQQNKEIREKTRELILTTALELFAVKGYRGTSVSDIAEAAKISKGLAYNYFESKQQLAEEVFNLLRYEVEQMMLVILKIDDPYEQIKSMITLTFDHIKGNEKFWKMYFSFALQQDVSKIAEEISGSFINEMFKVLEKIFKKIGIPNAVMEAKRFGAILDGVGIHYIFDKDNYPLQKMKKFLIEKYSKKNLERVKL